MLATLPLAAIPIVVLRDMGPLPGTSLRHTVWSPGRRLLVYGTNQPITPAEFSAPGQHDHDRARGLHRRPGRAGQGGRHP